MIRHAFRVSAVLLSSIVLVSCGDDVKPKPPASQGLCTRDGALIAARPACRADDTCPCGSHCVLGICQADCLASKDCGAGNRCDDFGLCRRKGDNEIVPPLTPVPEADVLVSPAHATSAAAELATQKVRITPRDLPPGLVRVVVDPGLEVRCAEDQGFVAECTALMTSAVEPLLVEVRATLPFAAGEVRTVRVFAGTRMRSMSIEGAQAPGAAEPLEGAYVGHAQMIGAGHGGADVTCRALTLPLTAEVHGSVAAGAVIALHDASGLLHPGGTWIGSIGGGSSPQVHFPDHVALAGEPLAGDGVEVIARTPAAPVAVHDRPRTVAFEVETHLEGVLPPALSTWSRWRVSLARAGEVSGTAPAVPPDDLPSLDLARAALPTAWEAAVRAAFPEVGLDDFDLQEDLLRCYLEPDESCRPQPGLNGCFLRASEREILASRASLLVWPSDVTVIGASGLKGVASSGIFSCAPAARETTAQLAGSENPVLAALGNALPAGALCGARVEHAAITVQLAEGSGAACQFELDAAHLEGRIPADGGVFDDYVLDAPFRPVNHDACQELAQRTGCRPTFLASPLPVTLLTWAYDSYLPAGLPAYYTQPISQEGALTGRVLRVCVQQPQDACAELAACASGREEATFAASFGPVSGEALCEEGPLSAALPIDRNADRPRSDLARLRAGAMLTACREDLAHVASTVPPDPDPYDLAAVFHDGACLDGPRFLTALGLATDADRARLEDPSVAEDVRASAYGHRLLQRWVALHGWIAQDAVDGEQLADVIRAAPLPGADPPRPIDEVLETSLSGWNLVLLPRFAAALQAMPESVLFAPDYRPYVAGAPVPAQRYEEQPVALSVVMLETLQSQLALAEIRLQKALFTDDASALAPASAVLRWTGMVRPMALALAARGIAEGQREGAPPVWLARAQHADAAVADLVERVLAASESLRSSHNPFGIEDGDLPLYFLGDTVGAGGRFAAISDYLLGPPQNDSAWAPALVDESGDALDAAREAFGLWQDRELQVQLSAREQTERVEGMAESAGRQILDLCGERSGLTAGEVLGAPDLDPDRCFLKVEEPACLPSDAAWLELVSPDDVEAQLCQVHELRRLLGEGAHFTDPALQAVADVYEACTSIGLETCGDGEGTCLRCVRGAGDLVVRVGFATLRGKVIPPGAASVVRVARDTCSEKVPGSRAELPGLEELAIDPLDRGSCYRGALGELALTARRAAKDVEIARSQFADLQDAYDIAMRSCIILQVGNDRIEEATRAHEETMHDLRVAKAVCDSAAAAAQAAKDCATAASGASVFGFATGAACGAAAAEAGFKIASIGIQARMDDVQAQHDQLIAGYEHEIAEKTCFNDAKQHLVGARTAALQVEAAAIDLQMAMKSFDEARARVPALYSEGRAGVALIEDREILPPGHDFWVNEAASTFVRKMRLAKRTTYLAVRAVEWEFQQSLSARASVLAAVEPSDLQAVLDDLWLTAGTRRINGNAPTELKVVLSLRDHLLRLADRTRTRPGVEGQLPLDPAERFRLLLRSPRFAVFDAEGAYLGQRIPFTLAPLGQLGQDGLGIPVLAGSDCAERLWSVNASVLGPGEMVRGARETFTRLELHKANTFYSQWCTPPGEDDPRFQAASVRPSHNLFRDPGLGAGVGTDFGVNAPAESFSRARVEAYFNVSRADFESDTYASGETSELAARGLYGEYALFLPAEVLSLPSGQDWTTGLVLNRVEDILLRLDYVSVAR